MSKKNEALNGQDVPPDDPATGGAQADPVLAMLADTIFNDLKPAYSPEQARYMCTREIWYLFEQVYPTGLTEASVARMLCERGFKLAYRGPGYEWLVDF